LEKNNYQLVVVGILFIKYYFYSWLWYIFQNISKILPNFIC